MSKSELVIDKQTIVGAFPSNSALSDVVLALQNTGFDIGKLSALKTVCAPNFGTTDILPHPIGEMPPPPSGEMPPHPPGEMPPHPSGEMPPHPPGVLPHQSSGERPPHPPEVLAPNIHFLPERAPYSTLGISLLGAKEAGVLFLPGMGPVLMAGVVATLLVSWVEEMIASGVALTEIDRMGGLSKGLGVAEENAIQSETELRAGKFILLVTGTDADIDRVQQLVPAADRV